jgi:hypothetical protein
MATTQAAASTVDPAKWLAMFSRWQPAASVEVLTALLKSLMEAAASGDGGRLRLAGLGELLAIVDKRLWTGLQKIEWVKEETLAFADPLHWPTFKKERELLLANAVIAAMRRAPDEMLSVEQIWKAVRKVKPEIRRGASNQLVLKMAACGWIERVADGIYGVPNEARASYKSKTQRFFGLVYAAPGHEMAEPAALAALGWSKAEFCCARGELRRKGYFEPSSGNGVLKVAAVRLVTN